MRGNWIKEETNKVILRKKALKALAEAKALKKPVIFLRKNKQ